MKPLVHARLLPVRSVSGGEGPSGLPTEQALQNIRSDINPDAGVNLRKATLEENMKRNKAAQASLKNRSSLEKREDLCEMLGRGC